MPLPSPASAGALAVIALMPVAVRVAFPAAFATPVVRLSNAPRSESESLPARVMDALAAATPVAGPGPTVAREDTMFTEVPEVLVQAPRVTLDEILERVAGGEARRESLLTDEQFTATFRLVRGIGTKQGPELLSERVVRVYKKKPHFA